MTATNPPLPQSQPILEASAPAADSAFEPFVPTSADIPEFTWGAVILGALLGILFGASSVYLVLRVGMTVSASIPVAVLSITLFRGFSYMLGLRRATILENNIVQTTGSAGESIAFGVGVTMPALLLLGFDMDPIRVMTVGVLGGLLGILMMIPLRRLFIVRQHGKLTYPEGTACADVLIVGERGGATAVMVFVGFFIAFFYKLAVASAKLWTDTISKALYTATGKGLPGAALACDVSPELLGVGYIIGPRTSSTMLAGGVLAYLVIAPLIVFFTGHQSAPLLPATQLVRNMGPSEIRNAYLLYIGAGAVAAGGVISMFQSMPLIFGSIFSGLRDLGAAKHPGAAQSAAGDRTERDLPMSVVFLGCVGLVLALAAAPRLGLGFSGAGLAGAVLIVIFGFLFVTVSSRLTGEIGSSSNPISGMTVATLLFTCLAFLVLGHTDKTATLTAVTVAAVVCIASSNGGGTSQDLKTGYLVGATPRKQQFAIVIGTVTSALVIGLTLLLLNSAGTIWTKHPENLPSASFHVADVSALTRTERAGGEYASDPTLYHVLHVADGEIKDIPAGRYLVDDSGTVRYLVDPAINGRVETTDAGIKRPLVFDAPKTRLMALIVGGILNQKLPWSLVLTGVLIAITIELLGVPALPFAVGVYLPLAVSASVFVGGVVRWLADRLTRRKRANAELAAGSLLATGYIAGGTIGGVVYAFTTFSKPLNDFLDLNRFLPKDWDTRNMPAVIAFGSITLILLIVACLQFAGGRSDGGPAPITENATKPAPTDSTQIDAGANPSTV